MSFSQKGGGEKDIASLSNSQLVVHKRVLTEDELNKVLRFNDGRKTKVDAQVYLDGKLEMTFEDIQSKPCRCDPENMFQYNFVDKEMNMISVASSSKNNDYSHFSVVLITEYLDTK